MPPPTAPPTPSAGTSSKSAIFGSSGSNVFTGGPDPAGRVITFAGKELLNSGSSGITLNHHAQRIRIKVKMEHVTSE